VIFRDESAIVAEKEVARRLPRSLDIPVEDKARGFFISHYVTGSSRAFDYIPPFLEPSKVDAHVYASISAVSLAHFSNKEHSPKVLHLARQKYVSALNKTNTALASPESAARDETLLSVLLLDLFEKITRTTPRYFPGWTSHVTGAIALAKLRGTKQFLTPIGIRMFVQLTSTILISCVQQDTSPPAELISLRDQAAKYLNVQDPKWRYSALVIQFIRLRRAMKDGALSSTDLIYAAKKIDEDFQSILDTMPPGWKFDRVHIPDHSDDVFDNYFDIYPDHRITHIWNNIRLSRIQINENIRQQCVQGLESKVLDTFASDYAAEIDRCQQNMVALSHDIAASIPQYTRVRYLSNVSNEFRLPSSEISQSVNEFPTFNDSASHSWASPRFYYYPTIPDRDQHYTPFEAARCYSLIFAIYIAARCVFTTASLRTWLIGRLRFLSTMNIKEAKMAAEVLERNENVNPWTVYAMLGSYSFTA